MTTEKRLQRSIDDRWIGGEMRLPGGVAQHHDRLLVLGGAVGFGESATEDRTQPQKVASVTIMANN